MDPEDTGKLLLLLFEMGGVLGTVSIRTEQGLMNEKLPWVLALEDLGQA
jgi:hypothetical protein